MGRKSLVVILKANKTENEQLKKYKQAIFMEWSEPNKVDRDSYIHQADEIPFKLRKIKHYLAEKVAGRDSENRFSQDNATELARLEHERLISERLYKHRTLDLSPAQGQVVLPPLIPWDDLALEWREVYQKLVQSIPKILKECGYSVYDLQKKMELNSNRDWLFILPSISLSGCFC
ncbi:hypothetical protein BDV23DRAFT_167777 [Aspergillus alliaceus]|uniref:Uncharacterized protein n=1 Tax=Petromyces alliaceus TaxID=209559 RepID=A0A5N7BQ53_PETAA|nr:hypothetical protein BDV23DRAFT_167777 [Aspergillus alliaceus]